MELINLCPHPVCVRHPNGTETLIPQAGLARVSVSYKAAGQVHVNGSAVQLIAGNYGGITGLPHPKDGVLYLVSHMVRMASPNRRDLLSPADILRDTAGNIIGCRMFEINSEVASSTGASTS